MSTSKGDNVDMRVIVRSVTAGVGALALLISSISCGDVVRQGRAPVLLVIDAIEAAPGSDPTTLSAFLLSDVQTLVEQTINGVAVRVPTIFNDVGEATLRVVMKDQGTGGVGVGPSELNSVTLRRYRIVYSRADGRNTPGVDVPFPVDGGVSGTITGGPSTVGFELVRHQAKLEQPLRSIAGFGGRLFISTIAEITFYGADLSGNEVQATGTISVSFGDYADPN
jgi:hypothetical protein